MCGNLGLRGLCGPCSNSLSFESVTITAATSGIWGAKQKCMARAQNVADAPFWMSATTRMMLGPPVVEVSLRAIHLVLTIFRPIVRA